MISEERMMGIVLKLIRLGTGLTSDELAKSCGLTAQDVAQVELGYRAPFGIIRVMSNTLGLDVQSLFEITKTFRQTDAVAVVLDVVARLADSMNPEAIRHLIQEGGGFRLP